MGKESFVRRYLIFRPVLWVKLLLDFEKAAARKRKPVDKSSNEYIQYQRCLPWFADRGDETLRLNYDLSPSSVVFDVGGFEGEFASSIHDKYGSVVYVFEPLPQFYEIIRNKFSNNEKVKPFCFGLSDKTATEYISFTGDKSSVFIDANKTAIQLKRAVDFIRENNISVIDLMKVNIEGSEYALLEDLLRNNEMGKIKNLQVQFHDFIVPNAKERMQKIQQALSKTHELTYQYEFVWENWKLKE